ncbi:hypothetical protein C7476_12054 [Phyllobacterium bourgognense]|uniref:Uncharacterized protein n=1 Tax=Phyllobacterium bourgognense TaxID=314236 RepID=A0A368YI57_9HYPH|nr:hypothetical protein C7476_12054 [Phyllobacterium bourgognense]
MKLLLMKGHNMSFAKNIARLLLEGIKARAEAMWLPARSGTQDTPRAPDRNTAAESSRSGGAGGWPQ